MTDFAAHIAEEEAHIRKMAEAPGSRDYAKDKAEKMAKWQPSMYGHFPKVVADTINQEQTP